MSQRLERVRALDRDEFRFGDPVSAEKLDPRNALSEASRDRMIAIRRRAELPAYPPVPLAPELLPRFRPDGDRIAAD